MLATLLVPWPRPRLSSDRAAIASPSRCCLLISNASCGLGGFACAAHAVRKMSLPSPQSRRTYAGLRSWSLDRHQRPMHVLRSRCHVSVPFDQRHRSAKERMVRTLPRDRGSSLAAIIAAFCNNICQKRTHAPQQNESYSITSSAGGTRFRLADLRGFANPRQPRFASPVGVRPNSTRGGTVFGANEAQVADDFVAAAMVRRMIDAVDHRHVGKIKRAHAL